METIVKTYSSREAKTNFSTFVRSAESEPTRVTRHGKPAIVALSEEQYDRLSSNKRQRFMKSFHALQEDARKTGLTAEKLDSILESIDE